MAKKKTRKVSKKKITTAILILVLIIGIITAVCFYLNSNKEKDTTIKIKSVDTIEDYDYTLSSNATKYYKSLFKELKNVLESEDIDEEKYADLVTKLFVADFYNLDNKINKNDIGGTQFVYKKYRDDFKKLATTSIYKSIENNLYKERNQTLPEVTNVSTEKAQTDTFTYGDKSDDKAYTIEFEITYKEDLDYQTKGHITLIHNGKKLEIAELTDN